MHANEESEIAITLRTLLIETSNTYHMDILAGSNGLDHSVSWVHIIEDKSISSFLMGRELVFSTGIRQKDNSWMLPFCKELQKVGCSGVVFNMGPYIQKIPQEVIDFCNQADFPLITTPWESRLVEITQELGCMIIENRNKETTIHNIFKELIFNESYYEYGISALQQNGYSIDQKYTVLCIRILKDNSDEVLMRQLSVRIEARIRHAFSGNKSAFFQLDDQFVLILPGKLWSNDKNFVEKLLHIMENEFNLKVSIGSGPEGLPASKLSRSYQLALKSARLAERLGKGYMFYEETDIYGLLAEIPHESVLKNFYNRHFQPLIEYDRHHNTDYAMFLREYVMAGFSIKELAKNTFLHRNTVYYKLEKIQEIMGDNYDLNLWKEKMDLVLCIYIEDLL